MSRGIFDSRVRPERPRIQLKKAFQHMLAKYGQSIEDHQLRGFPIQHFDSKGMFATPHILFVGDAAGVDPLFGEGISFALAYGQVAAREIVHAFASQDFTCSGYKKRILAHPILRQLRPRTNTAHVVYSLPRIPWLEGKIWDMTPWILQTLFRYRPHDLPVKHPRMIKITT